MSNEVVVLSAARSAIGSDGGGLSSFEPQELGSHRTRRSNPPLGG